MEFVICFDMRAPDFGAPLDELYRAALGDGNGRHSRLRVLYKVGSQKQTAERCRSAVLENRDYAAIEAARASP